MKRITKAALGGVASCALILGGTQLASSETLLQQVFPGWLTDLDSEGQFATTGAFDSAKAKLKVIEPSEGDTRFSIEVREIDTNFQGQTFVSHLHTGGCAIDKPTETEGHYKDIKDGLPLPPNEVWFYLTPDKDGFADSTAEVPFVPKDDGELSIVIHSNLPGAVKEVCLPVNAPTWISPVIETP